MSHSLNSLKGGYIGDYIGNYYRAYEGELGVKTMAQMEKKMANEVEAGFEYHCDPSTQMRKNQENEMEAG